MTRSRRQQSDRESGGLKALPESFAATDDGFEVVVRLKNLLPRSVHYIADLRAMIFDPATRRLRVQLSDQGRETPIGSIAMQPRFGTIDPQSEALITVRLPRTIVKLADSAAPTGEPLFEEYAIADAEAIDLEIGWADTPYYEDPRAKSRGARPVSDWEQETAQTTLEPPQPSTSGSS